MNGRRFLKFAPGAGMAPPVLAGRENEKAAIAAALGDLGAGFGPAANIALIGPRGNGKTSLLRWAEAQVGSDGGKLKCVELNPHCFKSHSDLVEALSDRATLSGLVRDRVSAGLNLFGMEFGLPKQEAAKKMLRPVLEKRCSEYGLMILIDEAHTLYHNPEVACAFFNDVQSITGSRRPLLLIIAGTPDTLSRLNEIEATFWNRLDMIGIGLLDVAAAREALRTPLERMGYEIEAGTLDRAVNAAQYYPYFLQLVGRELHNVAEAKLGKHGRGNEIGESHLEQALKEFRLARNAYYADRYRELRSLSLLPAAEAVARVFETNPEKSISTAVFEATVSRSIDKNLEEMAKNRGVREAELWVAEELRNVGFVWSQFGIEHICEPGLPGLMDYVMERAREREIARNPKSGPLDSPSEQ